jgi:hypothetical protein
MLLEHILIESFCHRSKDRKWARAVLENEMNEDDESRFLRNRARFVINGQGFDL